jgi:hypothetical protein
MVIPPPKETHMTRTHPTATLAALSLATIFAATAALAETTASSTAGGWKAQSTLGATVTVKQNSQATVKITGTSCPKLDAVLFEMPSHGHGGDIAPKATAGADCSWKVSDLVPSMAGDWRLRLVVKDGATSGFIDFPIQATK